MSIAHALANEHGQAEPASRGRAILRVAWLAAALAAAVALRASVPRDEPWPAFLAGAMFGAAALGVAALDGWRPRRPGRRGALIGLAGGLVLIAAPVLMGSRLVIGMRPEPFAAWALVTVLVASGEEVLLRGALLSSIEELAGLPAAIAATSLAFALLHVPTYGWGVLPLDLAAGVWLAGIRLTGGIGAAAAAHALADLATWWL